MLSFTTHALKTPWRIGAVAGVTFTQLIRMRTFVVLALFALFFLGLQFIPYQQNLGIEYQGLGELQLLRDVAMGCMRLFSMLFCIAATSLLLPRDSEDRILYTILSKPVPRFDYLAGKALGVLVVLGTMLLVMDGLMVGLLQLRSAEITQQLQEALAARNLGEQEMLPYLQQVAEASNVATAQWNLLASFLGYAVLTTFTLVISCFTSGTLVSMVFALGGYFIGMFREQLFSLIRSVGELGSAPNTTLHWVECVFSLVLPDFSLFNLSENADAIAEAGARMAGELGVIALGYMLLHLLIGAWILSHKEF